MLFGLESRHENFHGVEIDESSERSKILQFDEGIIISSRLI